MPSQVDVADMYPTLSIEPMGKNKEGERMVRLTLELPARSIERTRQIMRDAAAVGATIRYRSLLEYILLAWGHQNEQLVKATLAEKRELKRA